MCVCVCVCTVKGVVRTSKHYCGFTDHIKENLSNKGGAPFPSLAKTLCVLLQCEPHSEARAAGGCGGSGRSRQVLAHPGTARGDGETWRTCLTQGLLVWSHVSFGV